MFDQLTDYNENENDEQNQYSPGKRREVECRGEDSSDQGEGDDDNDLHEYRQRMQVLNEDIQSFMDCGEDADEENGLVSSNKVHNLQLNTQNEQKEEPKNCQTPEQPPGGNYSSPDNNSQLSPQEYNGEEEMEGEYESSSSPPTEINNQFSMFNLPMNQQL